MPTTEEIVEAKFLSVCSAQDAVEWLKHQRANVGRLNSIFRKDKTHQETVLESRKDPYIDFGLVRYGTTTEVAKKVYARGDMGIRCTALAHFPFGGFDAIMDKFELADNAPTELDEINALVSNDTLTDSKLIQCFEKKGSTFAPLNENEYQGVLIAVSDNPRLMRPYDDTFLDGWSDYRHHSVFTAAWKLSETVPNTLKWASVLCNLLSKCSTPSGFDPVPVLGRWYFANEKDEDPKDIGYYLRIRLADVLKADDALLKATDGALRESFYKRFSPVKYRQWDSFAKIDGECFFDGALHNEALWQAQELREVLSRLCWSHPDPTSDMMIPNRFRAIEVRMRSKHPEWFKDV
jgi:hypothetical protein